MLLYYNLDGHVLTIDRGGFQKEWELYFFFKIDDVFFFRQNLRVLADSIASTTQVLADEAKLQEWKKKPYNKGLMPLSRVNFALSRAGLNTVSLLLLHFLTAC
jgi:hypothetical protein